MIVERVSMLSGKTNRMELPITQEEITRWSAGELVQNVWPHLSEDAREFIMTGITSEEWDAAFKEDE